MNTPRPFLLLHSSYSILSTSLSPDHPTKIMNAQPPARPLISDTAAYVIGLVLVYIIFPQSLLLLSSATAVFLSIAALVYIFTWTWRWTWLIGSMPFRFIAAVYTALRELVEAFVHPVPRQ